MKKNKSKSLYLFTNGKKHCDVIDWALAMNIDKDTAKKMLIEEYKRFEKIEFKIL